MTTTKTEISYCATPYVTKESDPAAVFYGYEGVILCARPVGHEGQHGALTGMREDAPESERQLADDVLSDTLPPVDPDVWAKVRIGAAADEAARRAKVLRMKPADEQMKHCEDADGLVQHIGHLQAIANDAWHDCTEYPLEQEGEQDRPILDSARRRALEQEYVIAAQAYAIALFVQRESTPKDRP